MFSCKRVLAVGMAVLVLGAVPACTSDNPSPRPVHSASTGDVSPASDPTTTTTARDGRTVLPTSESQACSLLSEAAIRDALGEVSATLKPPQRSAERLPDGTTEDFCLYPFDEGGATTNALLVEVRTYASPQVAVESDPFALLMNAVDLPGLRKPAKFAVNTLSESTEFVVASLDGARVVRLVAAVPPATAWDRAAGQDHMTRLATAAGL